MAMNPIVLFISTPQPTNDAQVIRSIFGTSIATDEEIDGSWILQLTSSPAEPTIFILKHSTSPSRIPWVTQSVGTLEGLSGIHTRTGSFMESNTRFVDISLPSGSSIIAVASTCMETQEGRRGLLQLLHGMQENQSARQYPANVNLETDGSFESATTLLSPSPLAENVSLPKIPTLEATLLNLDGATTSFRLNTRTPVPFETELFRGELLFIVRPTIPTDDPYWNERIFSIKKRRLVVQIQGQFKREPKGIVFAGAELSDPMKLGLVTRGVSGILLRLVESFNSNVHYSYGDNEERAHIVVPAYTFFERVIATPPGEMPPSIGEPFEESSESMTSRKVTKSVGKWNTNDTYSLEFYSMYIDLPTWTLVSLPVSGNIALRTFWGNALLKICMYELETNAEMFRDQKHLEHLKRYVFAVQVKHDKDVKLPRDDKESDILRWSGSKPAPFVRQDSSSVDAIRRSESNIFDRASFPTEVEFDEEEADEEMYFFDAEEMADNHTDVTVDQQDDDSTELSLLRRIDDVCPAWLEVCDQGKSYSKSFVIVHEDKTSLLPIHVCEDLLRESKHTITRVSEKYSPRLSSNEKIRRALALTFLDPEQTDAKKLQLLSLRGCSLSDVFLNKQEPKLSEKHRSTIRLSNFAGRAISDRHWIEEWATIGARRISFFHPEKRRPHFHVPFSGITDVAPLPRENLPNFPRHYFLAIKTIGRTVYIMFDSESTRDLWVGTLRTVTSKDQRYVDAESISSEASHVVWATLLGEVDNPADEFMHKSSMWHCKSRRILNCGSFAFHSRTIGTREPLEVVETALREVIKVSLESSLNLKVRRGFLDFASDLKCVNLHGFTEDQKLAFFLNLYHTMVSHAQLVAGPPNSSLQWISYFNNMSYQIGDEILSLAELEHCIIRSRMANPSQILSRLAIPKSSYPHLALRSNPDYRINFALNCGSLSNPPHVLVYKEKELDRQLDAATNLYLAHAQATVTRKTTMLRDDVIVSLPRICQWYFDDFGGSNVALIEKLRSYLPDQELLNSVDLNSITIRYFPFKFECRPLCLSEQ